MDFFAWCWLLLRPVPNLLGSHLEARTKVYCGWRRCGLWVLRRISAGFTVRSHGDVPVRGNVRLEWPARPRIAGGRSDAARVHGNQSVDRLGSLQDRKGSMELVRRGCWRNRVLSLFRFSVSESDRVQRPARRGAEKSAE